MDSWIILWILMDQRLHLLGKYFFTYLLITFRNYYYAKFNDLDIFNMHDFLLFLLYREILKFSPNQTFR